VTSHSGNAPIIENGLNYKKPKLKPSDFTTGFTDNQWYCHLARQTVFFSAFSNRPFAMDEAVEIVREIFTLAPHILQNYNADFTEDTLDENMLSSIISLEQTANLDEFPDKWSMKGDEIFDNSELPPLRVKVAMLKNGPDEKGRFAALLILSTHSMFEGVDATSLARSRRVQRGAVTKKPASISKTKKLGNTVLAALLAPLQLLAAYLFAPRTGDVGFKSLVISRSHLRTAANKLEISQQALIFALASFALNGKERVFSKKSLSSIYADLSQTDDFKTNDDFFQFRLINLNMPVKENFEDFALGVAKALQQAQSGNKSDTQSFLNAMFGMHRRIHSFFPSLYTPKLFRFTAGYDFSLSLAPPHHLAGNLTKGLVEPVFTGTYHPGFNVCVFSPGRTYVTFSFALRQRYLKNVENIPVLLEQLL